MNFKDRLEQVRKDNSQINQLNRIKKLITSHKIKDNIVLKKMKREHWIIDNNNKHILAWACENTMNIVIACLYPNELNEKIKSKEVMGE